jgi:hypothetical protein
MGSPVSQRGDQSCRDTGIGAAGGRSGQNLFFFASLICLMQFHPTQLTRRVAVRAATSNATNRLGMTDFEAEPVNKPTDNQRAERKG